MNPEDPSRLLPLAGATNFRDLGGYVGHDGRRVRWRRLFRSDHLSALTPEDHARLAALGLGTAVDFRGLAEREAMPYSLPGVRQMSLAIEPTVVQRMDELAADGRPRDAALAAAAMRHLYVQLVDHSAPHFATLFAQLLETDRPLVFHCTAGKDRTGVAAALLLLALDVHRDAVMHDFLLTRQHYRRPAGIMLGTPLDVLEVMWSVQEDFLQAALARIDEAHGGVQRYLAERLGMDGAAQAALASRLLQG
jgi:protein-tyrosine phosphatase